MEWRQMPLNAVGVANLGFASGQAKGSQNESIKLQRI
jgi:hypothetical protein